MSKINKPRYYKHEKTHEGAPAKQINAEAQLRRTLMATMLWEDNFYEDGQSVAERISTLVPSIGPATLFQMATDAREKMKLRHVPLLLAREMARHPNTKPLVAQTLERIIQRPDELAEFLAIYWKDKKQPLSAQVKKGLARAFKKFDAFQLAKYNRDGAIKLRDVLFLSHAKPKDKEQERTFKMLAGGELATPDTWEVELSKGEGKKSEQDKKASWERLLRENKMGGLALLRNLRNFREANVDPYLVQHAIHNMKTERILPFRFIAAARYAPDLESMLEAKMFQCLENTEILEGRTVLLVDVSGSMDSPISSKSELKRIDAACGLGMLLREITAEGQVFTFSDQMAQIPPRRGFALRDAIVSSLPHCSTFIGRAMDTLNDMQRRGHLKADRLIVITDEQSHDFVPNPMFEKAYMINVASNKNGVGYGKWTHIDGWSEAIVDYIREFERNYSTQDTE